MGKFLNSLDVEQVEDTSHDGRGTWRLLTPLRYYCSLLSKILVVPAGFVTDFASVPRLPIAFWMVGDRANEAAALHDWLYTSTNGKHPVANRATADAILREAAIAQGCPSWVAWTLWAGVRVGGASHWT